MRFVEESDGTFSAAQLAAAERELEEQKKEWEIDRIRAMREEEERQKRLSDDDENPITFSSEDAKNQVNKSNSSRRAFNRLGVKTNSRGRPRKRGRRPSIPNNVPRQQKRGSRRSSRLKTDEEQEDMTTSDSEVDTASMTDVDSQDDDVARNSSDDHHDSRASSSDDDDNDNDNDDDESDENGDCDDEKENNERKEEGDYSNHTPTKNKLITSCKKNHFDINSPRTRSRGDVRINLWTLDVSPILPASKTKHRGRKSKKCS